ncbi:MAG: Fic family protein [Deltaproteobacteria bacterium]|jgi:hypothetical protein|nr:Fic family protein [Deltaproteobacteria bacterium]
MKYQAELPSLFLSSQMSAQKIYYLLRKGKIRKITPTLCTSNLKDDVDSIVRQNLWIIVGLLYPQAIISERTAVEMKITGDGSIFVVSDKKRPTTVGNITIRPRKGAPPQPTDTPFMENLYMASPARIVLENTKISRSYNGAVARGLSRRELEEYLDRFIAQKGEAAVNKLRDNMRTLSRNINMQTEFEVVNKLISALLQTHEDDLQSAAGIARSRGLPYDSRREELFVKLFLELEGTAPVIRQGTSSDTLAFFEAYFSNFIEGTEFEVSEAQNIVFKNLTPVDRPEDAHDVKGTYAIVSDTAEMSKTPENFDELLELLKRRHNILLSARPDKEPGIFKTKANRAGITSFVSPELVPGTLKQGFGFYTRLSSPLAKAIFMMFMVAEVHPFSDGNGRVGRIMMNAELVSAGEQRIIIPTVYRNNYLQALRALSHNGIPNPLVRMLDFAQKYTKAVRWDNFDQTVETLTKTYAFLDPNVADDEGSRLILPSRVID